MFGGIERDRVEQLNSSSNPRLECFAKKTPEQFMNFFDDVEEAFRYFIRSNPALTEEQFKFIYSIRKSLKEV